MVLSNTIRYSLTNREDLQPKWTDSMKEPLGRFFKNQLCARSRCFVDIYYVPVDLEYALVDLGVVVLQRCQVEIEWLSSTRSNICAALRLKISWFGIILHCSFVILGFS